MITVGPTFYLPPMLSDHLFVVTDWDFRPPLPPCWRHSNTLNIQIMVAKSWSFFLVDRVCLLFRVWFCVSGLFVIILFYFIIVCTICAVSTARPYRVSQNV